MNDEYIFGLRDVTDIFFEHVVQPVDGKGRSCPVDHENFLGVIFPQPFFEDIYVALLQRNISRAR